MKTVLLGFAVIVGVVVGACVLGYLNVVAIDNQSFASPHPHWQVIAARIICGTLYSVFIISWSYAIGEHIQKKRSNDEQEEVTDEEVKEEGESAAGESRRAKSQAGEIAKHGRQPDR